MFDLTKNNANFCEKCLKKSKNIKKLLAKKRFIV